MWTKVRESFLHLVGLYVDGLKVKWLRVKQSLLLSKQITIKHKMEQNMPVIQFPVIGCQKHQVLFYCCSFGETH